MPSEVIFKRQCEVWFFFKYLSRRERGQKYMNYNMFGKVVWVSVWIRVGVVGDYTR